MINSNVRNGTFRRTQEAHIRQRSLLRRALLSFQVPLQRASKTLTYNKPEIMALGKNVRTTFKKKPIENVPQSTRSKQKLPLTALTIRKVDSFTCYYFFSTLNLNLTFFVDDSAVRLLWLA